MIVLLSFLDRKATLSTLFPRWWTEEMRIYYTKPEVVLNQTPYDSPVLLQLDCTLCTEQAVSKPYRSSLIIRWVRQQQPKVLRHKIYALDFIHHHTICRSEQILSYLDDCWLESKELFSNDATSWATYRIAKRRRKDMHYFPNKRAQIERARMPLVALMEYLGCMQTWWKYSINKLNVVHVYTMLDFKFESFFASYVCVLWAKKAI